MYYTVIVDLEESREDRGYICRPCSPTAFPRNLPKIGKMEAFGATKEEAARNLGKTAVLAYPKHAFGIYANHYGDLPMSGVFVQPDGLGKLAKEE